MLRHAAIAIVVLAVVSVPRPVRCGLSSAVECGKCPPGLKCEGFKSSGTGTECKCRCWDSAGKCMAGGWEKTKGDGTCDFDPNVPVPVPVEPKPCACPVGKECPAVKWSGAGTECKCRCWDSAGECTADGWERTKGTGTCDFDPNVPVPVPVEPKPCACPVGKECPAVKFNGAGTECKCRCWDSAGECTADGWERTKGTGTCDFDPNVPVKPAKGKRCACPPGKRCESVKWDGTGTRCKCRCWDSAGKCTPGSWKRTKGTGTCDFDPTVPVKFTKAKRKRCACPVGKQCPAVKLNGTGTECKCRCWNAAGECTAKGWKRTKGTGTCDFDPNVPVPVPVERKPCACPVGKECPAVKSSGTGTECRCTCWDSAGECAVDGWERTKGTGTCDFDPNVPVPVPVEPKPCACPVGKQCPAVKLSGTGTECRCRCWDSAGECTADGWERTKGTGTCDFEFPQSG